MCRKATGNQQATHIAMPRAQVSRVFLILLKIPLRFRRRTALTARNECPPNLFGQIPGPHGNDAPIVVTPVSKPDNLVRPASENNQQSPTISYGCQARWQQASFHFENDRDELPVHRASFGEMTIRLKNM